MSGVTLDMTNALPEQREMLTFVAGGIWDRAEDTEYPNLRFVGGCLNAHNATNLNALEYVGITLTA